MVSEGGEASDSSRTRGRHGEAHRPKSVGGGGIRRDDRREDRREAARPRGGTKLRRTWIVGVEGRGRRREESSERANKRGGGRGRRDVEPVMDVRGSGWGGRGGGRRRAGTEEDKGTQIGVKCVGGGELENGFSPLLAILSFPHSPKRRARGGVGWDGRIRAHGYPAVSRKEGAEARRAGGRMREEGGGLTSLVSPSSSAFDGQQKKTENGRTKPRG